MRGEDQARHRLLPEIQALRALAVLAVVVFHLWPGRLPGGYVGVDVFFTISGFLITAHLTRELHASGRIRLGRFWARRIRRLLPAALLVLAVTLAATLLIAPATAWQRIVGEIAAAAVYVLNWLLAANAIDYFAAENAASPVQHYWSLSVEEQFYLGWPVLLLATAVLARRRSGDSTKAIRAAVVVVFGLSFACSVLWTANHPQSAYFATFTHAWEFALGGWLALSADALDRWRRRVPATGRAILSALGVAAIAVACLTFTGATPFPGWVALLPAIGATLVIAAGDTTPSRFSPTYLYRLRPVQYLGDISYSTYLWHWPPIVLLPILLDRELDGSTKLVILAATLVAAGLTKRFIEDPVRHEPRFAVRSRHSFAFAAAGAAILIVGSAVPWSIVESREAAAAERADLIAGQLMDPSNCLGAAAALERGCIDEHVVDPELLFISTDEYRENSTKEVQLGGALVADQYGSEDADVTIALIGDSHARHYLPALRILAEKHDWRIWLLQVRSCSPSTATWESSWRSDQSAGCLAWRKDLETRLSEVGDIDLVVTSSVAPRYARTETLPRQAEISAAFSQMWDAWLSAGIPVIVVADVPGPGDDIGEARECVAAAGAQADPCTSPRNDVLERDAMVVAASEEPREGLTLLDFTPVYCDESVCHTVVGNMVVYGGGAHISRLFSMSLAPYFEVPILDALR